MKYDRVNVDLNNKPDWFFDINFYGEVPVIIHEGKNVYESLICTGMCVRVFVSVCVCLLVCVCVCAFVSVWVRLL